MCYTERTGIPWIVAEVELPRNPVNLDIILHGATEHRAAYVRGILGQSLFELITVHDQCLVTILGHHGFTEAQMLFLEHCTTSNQARRGLSAGTHCMAQTIVCSRIFRCSATLLPQASPRRNNLILR